MEAGSGGGRLRKERVRKELCIGVGEDAEMLLSVEEDILIRRFAPWSNAAF